MNGDDPLSQYIANRQAPPAPTPPAPVPGRSWLDEKPTLPLSPLLILPNIAAAVAMKPADVLAIFQSPSGMAEARPAVARLGPNFDYHALSRIAEQGKDKLPPEIYLKMKATSILGIQGQLVRRISGVAQGEQVGTAELARQATFGLVPSAENLGLEMNDLSPAGVSVAKAIGAMAGVAVSGKLVYSVLSKVTLLPKVGALIAQVPQRIREVTLGVGTAAILDAARPDGLPDDPAAIDVPARLAHPLAKAFGGGEVAERASLAITGGAMGGLVGELLGPVLRGIQAGREARFASRLTPEMEAFMRTQLNAAGIGVEKGVTKQAVAARYIRNLDKVTQTDRLAAVTGADETRMEFIAQQLYTDPAFSGPPKLPLTKVVTPDGQPMRVYRGHYGTGPERDIQFFAEDPTHANAYNQPMGPSPEGQRITPAYLDIRNPIDLTGELGKAPPLPNNFLDEYEKIAGTREVFSGDVIGSEEDVVAAARNAGYDGIKYTVPEFYVPLRVKAGIKSYDSWVALNPAKQIIPAFVSDDARLMAAVFRANPGGMSIAKGITNVRAADELVKRMGLNVTAIKAGEDYLLLRPKVDFPIHPVNPRLSKQMADFTDYVAAQNRGKQATRLSILPDGSVARGEYSSTEMVSRYKLKPPVVGGGELPDYAVREHFGLVDVQVQEGGKITVQLPSTVSQRQVNLLSRMADRGPEEITFLSAKPGLTKTVNNPLGMQIPDILGDMVQGATRPKIGSDVLAKVAQYQREGVFNGQAAHLADGYPVEVLRRVTNRAGEGTVIYRDPLTQSVHRIPEENIAILPTSLEGEHAPTNAFMDALDPVERQAFATLRRGINERLADPIKTFTQFESFASSRGKFAENLGKGQIRVRDPNTGEAQVYADIKAAVTGVKNSLGPLPDLTPPEIEELLGYKPNVGAIGNGGPPARFSEPVAITADEFDRAATTNTLGKLVPGALEQIFKPSRGLFLDLEKRYGLPFGRVFLNLQDGTVHRQNFAAAWIYGEGPGLPQGVKPLESIYQMAGGKTANQRLITSWLESESSASARATIEAQMKPREIQAAQELRKWYNGMFDTFGIESGFLTDYAPHIRANAEAYGNDIADLWRRTRGTALPKAVDFFADYARDGSLNLYEDRAFVSASQYLNAGARSRFMNSAMDDAKKLLRAVSDNAVKAPLSNYLEALRGSEFAPQRAALDASFQRFMQNLGTSTGVAKDIGEKLSLNLLGLTYSATMAFRPGLAIRNAAQIYQTLWPLVGRFDDTFAEAIGRAMTTAGRDEAIKAGAIAVKQNAVFAGEEVAQAMPAPLRAMSEMGMKMYDSADVFARSVAFHAGKLSAQKAIEQFAQSLKSGTSLEEAQRVLIRRSGAMVLDKPIVDDFMRRIAVSPENASDLIGKQIADVTQYLYGRGNQPRWMRSVPGRFLGQFGTWPLWFIDYTKRSFLNMWQNGYRKEAIAFLGKLALVDTAIYAAGDAIGLDFRKWMAGNTLFYTGGPAVEAVRGTMDLVRGAGEDFLGTYESPATKQRIASGAQTLQRVGLAFVPGMQAVKDMGRLLNATTPTEALGAFLASRPNTDYTVEQRLELLFNPGRLSTDTDLETKDPATKTAAELMIQGMSMSRRQNERLPLPLNSEPLPTQPQGYSVPRGGGPARVRVTGPAVQGRPPLEPTALPESIRTGESKPPQE